MFFSREGFTKKIACEKANRSGAQVFEITTDEKIEGTTGFYGAGGSECIDGQWIFMKSLMILIP